MSDAAIFAAIILVVIVLALVFGIGIKQLPVWAKSKAGKGAIASMLLGIGVIVVVGVLMALGNKAHAQTNTLLDNRFGHFFNYAYTFAGVDYTRKVSPQCVAGSQDDRLTSNMGFGLNMWESTSRRVSMDLRYTHHSCVIGKDRN
jgi:ABC-type transport system involved in multi-copper enzyme maturation permease subunit